MRASANWLICANENHASNKMTNNNDSRYLHAILKPIRVCANYRPKFGQGTRIGYSLEEFRTHYQADSFYNWFGLDHPLMYAAHKAAGGMTSIYRQIGIGCENLFRLILQDALGLSDDSVRWSYETTTANNKQRMLHLDGRVILGEIEDAAVQARFRAWMKAAADGIGVADNVFASLTGTVFEVRQGYKSKDSKRQNADIANAAAAYVNGYLPCAIILSNQIDGDVLTRYRAEKWSVLTGVVGLNKPLLSTYDFMRDIVGYDLAAFLARHSQTLRREIEAVLQTLLKPD